MVHAKSIFKRFGKTAAGKERWIIAASGTEPYDC